MKSSRDPAKGAPPAGREERRDDRVDPTSSPLISSVHITGYKSIRDLTLELDRVTMLVGANGCGKTNILEAITLGAAAASSRLDNEWLALSGIRMTHPRVLRSGLAPFQPGTPITVDVTGGSRSLRARLTLDEAAPYPSWGAIVSDESDLTPRDSRLADLLNKYGSIHDVPRHELVAFVEHVLTIEEPPEAHVVRSFVAYNPQLATLRALQPSPHLEPLGVYGEGLFRLLRTLQSDPEQRKEIDEALRLIGWYDGYQVTEDVDERHIRAQDLFLDPAFGPMDETLANEGFLVLLFYVCLLVSPLTPRFFAIDNVDAGLNPKLAARAVRMIRELAAKHGKQVILTTHNPAALDGLDLEAGDCKLVVVRRDPEGATVVAAVPARSLSGGPRTIPLSEAFMRGYLGGLPTEF